MPDLIPHTFQEALDIQAAYLTQAGKHAAEHGYIVTINANVKDIAPNTIRFPFSFFNGALDEFVKEWNKAKGSHILIVGLVPGDQNVNSFYCNIPNRFWSKGLVASIEILSRTRKGGHDKPTSAQGSSLFDMVQFTTHYRVTGMGNNAIKSFFNMLDMPHNRAMLLGKGRRELLNSEGN
jgi:hypothetical protein